MAERKSAEREFDLVVWGATGFTGRLTAEYVALHYGPGSAQPLRLALGGRSRERLEAVAADVREACRGTEGGAPEMGLVVADAADQAAVDAMARRTRVVVAAAGPFARFGTPVVSACARLGTDYVDITGEAPWVRNMIDQYGEAARKSGAVLVSMCGFDSVPADLSAFMLSEFARKHAGSPLAEVTSYVTTRGGVSGGTLSSMCNLMDDKELRAKLADPFLLNPADRRPAQARAHDKDVLCPGRSAEEECYTLPFVMAGVNNKVVRRSAALLGYGPNFSYNEVMAVRSFPVAVLTYLFLALFGLALAVPPVRHLLQHYVLPRPGTGPSAKQRSKSRFRYRARGVTEDGQRLQATVAGGCPGYGETSKMLAESGIALALRRAGQPVPGSKTPGFLTPAAAFGSVLVDRLVRAGMTLSVGRA